jgi:hypothetical protein
VIDGLSQTPQVLVQEFKVQIFHSFQKKSKGVSHGEVHTHPSVSSLVGETCLFYTGKVSLRPMCHCCYSALVSPEIGNTRGDKGAEVGLCFLLGARLAKAASVEAERNFSVTPSSWKWSGRRVGQAKGGCDKEKLP